MISLIPLRVLKDEGGGGGPDGSGPTSSSVHVDAVMGGIKPWKEGGKKKVKVRDEGEDDDGDEEKVTKGDTPGHDFHGNQYTPDPGASDEGEWVFPHEPQGPFGDKGEPRWRQSHAALVRDALRSWKGDPGHMSIHMRHERDNDPPSSAGSGKRMRSQAGALLWEIAHNAKTVDHALYRGEHIINADRVPKVGDVIDHTSRPRGYSYNRTTARKFSKPTPGERKGTSVVFASEPGARGLKVKDYEQGSGLDQIEQEYVVGGRHQVTEVASRGDYLLVKTRPVDEKKVAKAGPADEARDDHGEWTSSNASANDLTTSLRSMAPQHTWSASYRDHLLSSLRSTSDGAVLADTLDRFQDGGSVARLRTSIHRYLSGDTTLNPTSARRASAVVTALRQAPSDLAPHTLYRGMSVPGSVEDVLARYSPNTGMDLNLTSFSSDRAIAVKYQLDTASPHHTRVMMEFVGEHKTVLPIQNLAHDHRLFKEKEWVGAGHFRVRDAKKSGDGGVLLRVEQVGKL